MSEPVRYHLTEPSITINGQAFGEGWLLISEDEYARLRAENERLRNNTNRFPELMEKIRAEKAARLSDRVSAVLSAIKAMPDGFGNYQWEADEKHLFGDKWVRSVAGNDGLGMGRQAIAATPDHLTGVAQYIAAANPDTVLMLIAENKRLTAERDEARGIVRDIHWMAVRYADNRKSYAVGMCNDAIRKAYDGGWLTYSEHRRHDLDPQYARDGMFDVEWRSAVHAADERSAAAEARAQAAEAREAKAVEDMRTACLGIILQHRDSYAEERDGLIERGKANAALWANLVAACDSIIKRVRALEARHAD